MVMFILSMLLIFFSMDYFGVLFILMVGLFLTEISLWNESYFMMVSFLFGCDLMSSLLLLLSFFLGIFLFLVFNIKNKMMNLLMGFIILFLMLSFSFINLLGFYLSFEAVLVPTVMLIVGMGGMAERTQAGMYMFFYTVFGSLPLLLGLIFMSDDSLNFLYLNYSDFTWSVSWWMVFLLAFLVKMPVFFVHLWLPKAHVEAPVEGSMILAGILLKLGSYGIMRIINLLWVKIMFWSGYFISVGLMGGFMASMICLRQSDLKSLIAYSSVAHMGLVLSGIMIWLKLGVVGGLLMMLGHGICSSCLFYLVNLFYNRFHTRSILVLKGMMVIFPSLAFWWFIFSMVNMSAPPSLNLISELFLLMGMISWSKISILGILMLSFFCAVFCITLFSMSHHGEMLSMMSSSPINVSEFNIIFLHFLPLGIMFMKIEVLFSWVYF